MRLSRRELLAQGAAAAALAALGGSCRPSGAGEASAPESSAAPVPGGGARPDILLVLSDAHRASALGCAVGAREAVLTPRFDAFAAQGLHLSSAVSSTPLCRPYRASLMSGAFSHHTGLVTNNRHPLNVGVSGSQWEPGRMGLTTLGRAFREAGYGCGYVGKWHLGEVQTASGDPRRLGFDEAWTVCARTPRDEQEMSAHDYWNWKYVTGEHEGFEGGGQFRAELETDLVIDLLARRAEERAAAAARGEPGRPWLLVLSWGPPHDPFTPPPGFAPQGPIELPPNVRDAASRAWAAENLPLYYGLVHVLDAQFGRLLDALARHGAEDRTLVIYTSDHGSMLGSQDSQGKEQPWSASTHVPFLLRWPDGLPGGRVLDAPLGTPDILPTLCGLAGLPAPAAVDGADRSAWLRGEDSAPAREAVLLQCLHSRAIEWPGWRGVRTASHLYARTKDTRWILHDLREDPWELHNLVREEAGRELRRDLDARLEALMEAAGDSWG